MAQNITLLGASYTAVPGVQLPKTGGGTALFTDVTPTTATASDVASGKVFFASDGTQTTGTGSGGGSSNWTLLASQDLQVTYSSTTAATAVDISCGAEARTSDDIIFVHIRDKAGKRPGYFYGSNAMFLNHYAANGTTSTFTTASVSTIRCNSGGTYTTLNGQYGVYGYSISNAGVVRIRKRYNSSSSLTIDGTYNIQIYKLSLPNGQKAFT